MKVKRKRPPHISPRSLRDEILSAWRELQRNSVGTDELLTIQKAVAHLHTEAISPATIARELASAGADLRHPEIIECDARWRESEIAGRLKILDDLMPLQKPEQLTLKDAEAAISKLEDLRVRLIVIPDDVSLVDIKELAIDARRRALNCANDTSLSKLGREVQAEIAEWLRVWLETPNLFAQWLELRKASESFQSKFAGD